VRLVVPSPAPDHEHSSLVAETHCSTAFFLLPLPAVRGFFFFFCFCDFLMVARLADDASHRGFFLCCSLLYECSARPLRSFPLMLVTPIPARIAAGFPFLRVPGSGSGDSPKTL